MTTGATTSVTTGARLLAILVLALALAPAAGAQPAATAASASGEAGAAASLGAQPAAPAPAPAAMPAPAAAPETTVGGGAANRPAPLPAAPMPAAPATASLLQTLFSLILVLGVLGALAWFLKRYAPSAMGGAANLRIVGSLNLGGRERLLVVEVGNQWIVVGASPGRVNALATMPRQAAVQEDGQERADPNATGVTLAPGDTPRPAASFADWLKHTIDKRK